MLLRWRLSDIAYFGYFPLSGGKLHHLGNSIDQEVLSAFLAGRFFLAAILLQNSRAPKDQPQY